MVFNRFNIYQILLFAEGVLLAFALLLIRLLAPDAIILFVVVAEIGLLLFVALLLCRYNQKKREALCQDALRALESLSDGSGGLPNHMNTGPLLAELLPFFQEVEKIRDNIRNADDNRQKILNIVNSVAANMEITKLLEDLMPKLIVVTRSNCGAFYLANNINNRLEIKYSLGFSKNVYSEFDLVLGEGLIGTAALNKEIKIINDIPEDTVYVIRTFLGKIKPKSIMIVPIVNQEQLAGVFTFASLFDYSEDQLEMVNLIKYYVGAAVGNGLTYEKTKRLTNELKFQNRLIQNLNDDLERKVQDRTLFLNDILNSIKDYAIYAIDREGIVLTWNQGAELLFGYSYDEMIGKPVETVYPEEELKAGLIKKRLSSATKDGKYTENGWRHRKDGSMYYAEMNLFTRYDQNGTLIGFTNVTKDITTLKNIESALWFEKEFNTRLVEGSSRALVLTDDKGRIKVFNKVSTYILGKDDLENCYIYDFFQENDILKANISLLKDAETESRVDWICRLKLGGQIKMNVSVMINETDQNRVLFINMT